MSKWDELSMAEKAEMMKVAVRNGITNLSDIKQKYNEFAEGGDTNPYTVGATVDALYASNPREEFLGEPSHHYDFTQSEEWANAHGYYPDARGHRDDRVKKPAHPSHPSRGTWNGDKFELTDLGIQNPNYTLFGLNDGGQDPQAVLTYQGGTVLPEITVTPKGNYILNSYDNIKIQYANGGNLYAGVPTDDDLVDFLIKEEGFIPHPKDIGDGKITLGSGLTAQKWHDLYKKRGNKWSSADNRKAVAEEVATRRRWAENNIPNWDSLPSSSQKALLAYKYNYDFTKENSPKLFKALSDSNLYEAAKQMDATSKDPQFKKGLMARRKREQNWFLSDIAPRSAQDYQMPITTEQPVSTTVVNPFVTKMEYTQRLPIMVPDEDAYVTTHTLSPSEQRRQKLRKTIEATQRFNNLMNLFGIQNTALPAFMPQTENTFLNTLGILNPKAEGGSIHIKPSHRGRLTELKERTGKTEAELYNDGNPAHKKMVVFARSARKWKHGLGGNLFDGTTEDSQQMQIGLNVPKVGFDVQGWPNYTTEQIVAYGEENEKRRKAIQDAYLNFVTESNDATAVANGRPQNKHLEERGIRGAKEHAAWEKEHPNLTAWGNTLAAVPFAVAAYPLVSTVGSGIAALGAAAAASSTGQAITAGLAPLATAASTSVAGAPLYTWADVGLSSLFGGHGVQTAIDEGGISPTTALELLPVTRVAKPAVEMGYNATKPVVDKAVTTLQNNYPALFDPYTSWDATLGYHGDNIFSRALGTVGRRHGFTPKAGVPEFHRRLNINRPSQLKLDEEGNMIISSGRTGEGHDGIVNFATSEPARGHSKHKSLSGIDDYIIDSKAIGNQDFKSIQPSDTFFETGQLAIDPKSMTLVSGNTEMLDYARSLGMKTLSSPRLRQLTASRMTKEDVINSRSGGIAKFLQNVGEIKYGKGQENAGQIGEEIQRLTSMRGTPTMQDYSYFENITGLNSGVRPAEMWNGTKEQGLELFGNWGKPRRTPIFNHVAYAPASNIEAIYREAKMGTRPWEDYYATLEKMPSARQQLGLNSAMDTYLGETIVPENFLTIKPQVRTRVGDVEIDNPNLLYHLDRGDRAGAFSTQGAYVEDGFLFPGTPKGASDTPYSWWNKGKPYATAVNGQPMTRLMTTTEDTPGMLHVRSQDYPIGQWNGKRGLVTNAEYVNPESVDVSGNTYILDPNYGWRRVFAEDTPAAEWSMDRIVQKAFGGKIKKRRR